MQRTDRRQFLGQMLFGGLTASLTSFTVPAKAQPRQKHPNFIIIFTDDQGYQDAGCYGATEFDTPNIDRMADEGMRFTDFYACAPVCTPSRAALMTGCYPDRVNLPGVLSHRSINGLHKNELTIAELLKQRGYATACYGKWHLGHHPEFLPMQHGFDDYFGLPYSNDMWPHHPTGTYPPLPLIDKNEIIDHNPDQTQLTTWYTERSVKFIEEHKDEPFFLYLPHSMPHVPLYVSDKFKGKSKQGLYGDVIMEIDWSVGQVLDTLRRLGLDENTLVLYSSDNGPWLSYGNHAGCALPLREGKGTTFDGGQRVPCIAWWPGKIPPNAVCSEVAAMFDFLPTFAHLAKAQMPQDRVIDGKNIWPLLAGEKGAQSPHHAFFYSFKKQVQAVRCGKWKLHVKHQYRTLEYAGKDGQPGQYNHPDIGPVLYNLEKDIGETTDVSKEHPEIVARLKKLIENFRKDLEENSRPAGRVRMKKR